MDQFENNTPVQGDAQGETSHNEPEQVPIQESPVQGTASQENGQEKPRDDVFAEQSFAGTQYRQTSNGYAQNGYAQNVQAQNGYAQNAQTQQPFDPYQQGADMHTAQCTATAMFPTAHMRQIRDSRLMRRRSSIRSMPSMHSRADMQLIPHRAGEFLPCRIYLRKR